MVPYLEHVVKGVRGEPSTKEISTDPVQIESDIKKVDTLFFPSLSLPFPSLFPPPPFFFYFLSMC